MGLFNTPRAVSRRPETLGEHPDLRGEERLILLATPAEVRQVYDQLVLALRGYYDDLPPVCVPIRRAEACMTAELQARNPRFFGDTRPMWISTTDGKKRLPAPVVKSAVNPGDYSGKRVLVIDPVLDTGHTLRTAISVIRTTVSDAGFVPPCDVAACVMVEKVGALKADIPELIAVGMLAKADDWVVGLSDAFHDGPDLDERFRRGLPGLWHIAIDK